MSAARRMKAASFRHLTRCRQLRELDLSYTEVRREDMAAVVAACPLLERLAVVVAYEYGMRMSTDWLPELRNCPGLRDLDLSGASIRNADLAVVVAACPQLERLSVAHCQGLTGDWLSRAETLPSATRPRLVTHLGRE